MKGKIIKNISDDYTVETDGEKYICKARGKFRNQKITPLVGDTVNINETSHSIIEIYPRKNSLIRPGIANIDAAIIVTSVKEPKLDTYLLDKTLTIISYHNIKPIIYFSKIDLLNNIEYKEIKKIINYYQKIGYDTTTNYLELLKLIENKTVVFTGQSGAGKSTLLNKINPKLNLKTDNISKALGRGKHTTRHTELYKVNKTYIADTPGFSKIDFIDMTNIDIRDNMKEMFNNLNDCKYKDCMHTSEEECKIIELVKNKKILQSRYDNYLKFINR